MLLRYAFVLNRARSLYMADSNVIQSQGLDSSSTSSRPRGRYDPTNPADKRTTLSLVKGQKAPQGFVQFFPILFFVFSRSLSDMSFRCSCIQTLHQPSHHSASAQIAALEAKLASMKKASGSSGSSSPAHPGLPNTEAAGLPSRPSGPLPPSELSGESGRMNGD